MKYIVFFFLVICGPCNGFADFSDLETGSYSANGSSEDHGKIYEELGDKFIDKAELRAFLLGKINQLAYEMSFQSAAKYDYRNDPKWNFLKGEMIAYYDILLWTSEIPLEVLD